MPLQAKGFGLWYVRLSGPRRRHGGCKDLFREMGSEEGPRGRRCAKSTLRSQGRSHFDTRGSAAHSNKMVVSAAADFNSLSCHLLTSRKARQATLTAPTGNLPSHRRPSREARGCSWTFWELAAPPG